MSMSKKILVPLDGSRVAESVLPYALAVARRTRAPLLLLSVIPRTDGWGELPPRGEKGKETAEAQAYLESRRQELAAQGVEVETELAYGHPAEEIVGRAGEGNVGLIAMSTHGRSGITLWLLGSVADKVLQRTPRPVLLVRGREAGAAGTGEPAIGRILVPLDGSPLSESVLPVVEGMARAFGSTLVLFHAVTPIAAYPGLETAQIPVGDVLEGLQAQAERFLGGVSQRLESSGFRVERMVSIGFAVDEIVGAARDARADLIALATHGRSGLGRWIMGSVASAVVRRADLPCLVIRPEEVEG